MYVSYLSLTVTLNTVFLFISCSKLKSIIPRYRRCNMKATNMCMKNYVNLAERNLRDKPWTRMQRKTTWLKYEWGIRNKHLQKNVRTFLVHCVKLGDDEENENVVLCKLGHALRHMLCTSTFPSSVCRLCTQIS